MLKFALKNMAVKKIQVILIVLSITLSAGVAVLAYNTAEQVSDGITQTAAYYSDIIGPAGSATQLAMNTMYFTDEPLGTIPFELVEELRQDDRVKQAIPFAMADSYNGYRVVGTESAYLSAKSIRDGRMFNDVGSMEAVLGYNVAKVCQLEVGAEVFTSHSSGEEHKQALTVVGIMDQTHTAYDNVLFTQIQTIWAVHEEEHEEHDHEEMRGMVCAILVTAKNPSYAMVLANEYDSAYTDADGASFALQAIEPMAVIRSVLEDTNTTKYIVYLLCGIILAMNIIIISVITLLNMYHSAKGYSGIAVLL